MQSDWERVQEIFLAALEHDPASRIAFVRASCAGSVSTFEEVVSLLHSHEQADDFIEQPVTPVSAASFDDGNVELRSGQDIGCYTIVSLLGAAGMGEVYLARDNEFGRQVAIKLIKRGFASADAIRQFRREERILAALNHPNIARFYGGAVVPNGVPYFVMEYVAGTRIDQYCDEYALTIPERLELFRKVCAAVHFAHQHLIVHRDLKPSNILVTNDREPKLLDFGIGKLLEVNHTSSPQVTVTLAPVMTPEYASPEHIRGEAVTTSSDIYSLGVLLYELLSGDRPYTLNTRRPDEMAKIICEREPARPSTVARDSRVVNEDPATNAPSRADSRFRIHGPRSTARSLRGDLDNIALKAMRKEPSRRYVSAAQLSEDIRRHLDGRPVIARPDTLSYRARKFIGRNKVGVIAALLVAAAILAGVTTALWQNRVARQERDTAQRMNLFLQDMLGAAAPEAKGRDIKVIEILAEASKRAQIELAGEPKVMADVLLTLGRTYLNLDQVAAAEANLRLALGTSIKANGELNETTASSMAWLGVALGYLNKSQEGEQLSRRAVELERKLHPHGNDTLAVGLYSLGLNMLLGGKGQAAVPILQEACEVVKQHLGANHGYYVAGLGALALAYEQSGNLKEAEATFRQANEVGATLEYRYQTFHAQVATYLGELLIKKGNYNEAEHFLREAENTYKQSMGDSTQSTGEIKQDLGTVYLQQKDYARGEAELRKSLDLLEKGLSPGHPSTLKTEVLLGLTLTREDRPIEGESYLRKALLLQSKTLPSHSDEIAFTEAALGECLVGQKRYAEAAPLLETSYTQLRANRGERDTLTLEAKERLKSLPTNQ